MLWLANTKAELSDKIKMEKYTIFNFGLLHLEWTNALFVLTVFSVLVFLLHFLLFKPVLRTVLNREKNQGSSEKEILQLQAEKEQTIQKTQEVEKQANLEMSLYRASQLKQTKEKLDRILNEKKMQLEKKSQEVRLEYQKNFKSIEENIESLSDEMVEELKIKVV